MKKSDGKKLSISKETLRVLDQDSLEKVGGGTAPIIVSVVVIVLVTTLLAGDTPHK